MESSELFFSKNKNRKSKKMRGWELEISNCKATLWSPLSSRDSEFVAHTMPRERGNYLSQVYVHPHTLTHTHIHMYVHTHTHTFTHTSILCRRCRRCRRPSGSIHRQSKNCFFFFPPSMLFRRCRRARGSIYRESFFFLFFSSMLRRRCRRARGSIYR